MRTQQLGLSRATVGRILRRLKLIASALTQLPTRLPVNYTPDEVVVKFDFLVEELTNMSRIWIAKDTQYANFSIFGLWDGTLVPQHTDVNEFEWKQTCHTSAKHCRDIGLFKLDYHPRWELLTHPHLTLYTRCVSQGSPCIQAFTTHQPGDPMKVPLFMDKGCNEVALQLLIRVVLQFSVCCESWLRY
jgi:hypothetical protein